MPTIEFEFPESKLNSVMDILTKSDILLRWVYHQKDRKSFVIKLVVPYSILTGLLLQLADVLNVPTEVSIVEGRNGDARIHEAFLVNVSRRSDSYPVVILLEYLTSKYYPSNITIGMAPNSPDDLVAAVLSLTVGRVRISNAELVYETLTREGRFLYLKTTEVWSKDTNVYRTVSI